MNEQHKRATSRVRLGPKSAAPPDRPMRPRAWLGRLECGLGLNRGPARTAPGARRVLTGPPPRSHQSDNEPTEPSLAGCRPPDRRVHSCPGVGQEGRRHRGEDAGGVPRVTIAGAASSYARFTPLMCRIHVPGTHTGVGQRLITFEGISVRANCSVDLSVRRFSPDGEGFTVGTDGHL